LLFHSTVLKILLLIGLAIGLADNGMARTSMGAGHVPAPMNVDHYIAVAATCSDGAVPPHHIASGQSCAPSNDVGEYSGKPDCCSAQCYFVFLLGVPVDGMVVMIVHSPAGGVDTQVTLGTSHALLFRPPILT